MALRLLITDAVWSTLEPLLRESKHAAGAVKNGGQEFQALGRSRGGFSTKLHVACANETTGVSFVLTGGERHDGVRFELLWKALPSSPAPEAAVMDKAYDSKGIRQALADQDVEAVIPARSNRTETVHHDQDKGQAAPAGRAILQQAQTIPSQRHTL